jgi:hypothetical protein
MPSFLARRYARDVHALGRVEKTLGAGIVLLAATVIAAFVYQVRTDRHYLFETNTTPAPAQATPAPQFPESGVAGWVAPTATEHFAPDELYVKIDGWADRLLELGCTGLTFATYREDDEDADIDVYLYEFGNQEVVAALYQAEKPPDVATLAVGTAGYQVGGAVFFYQATHYVQVLPSRPEDDAVVAAIAARVAKSIQQ